jgi:uncharacterized RDD family membrane protein YckC
MWIGRGRFMRAEHCSPQRGNPRAFMATPTAARTDEPLDTTVRLVTPERVRFQYPLAGPFRRSLSYLIDLLVMAGLSLVGLWVSMLLALGSSSGLGIYFTFLFALMWGYGAFWEGIFNGQTPGKKALGIRVVSAQGVPIAGTQAVLRNVLWAFDGILFGYIPAVACMMLTRRFQRLGDLAAGTMVMVEESHWRGRIARVDEPAVQNVLPWLPIGVDAGPEMARALADYVKHRNRFSRDRREEMAAHLAAPLRKIHGLPGDASADAIVCAMYHRVFLGD